MQKHAQTSLPPARGAQQLQQRTHYHPVGLLYTILRHGRGLPPEEAALRSLSAIGLPHRF